MSSCRSSRKLSHVQSIDVPAFTKNSSKLSKTKTAESGCMATVKIRYVNNVHGNEGQRSTSPVHFNAYFIHRSPLFHVLHPLHGTTALTGTEVLNNVRAAFAGKCGYFCLFTSLQMFHRPNLRVQLWFALFNPCSQRFFPLTCTTVKTR